MSFSTGTHCTTRTNPWIISYQARPQAKQRLICFAHAGGSASAYNTWHTHLSDSVEVCAVQLPGRYERGKQAFALQMDALTPQLMAALEPLEDRPFALFGYSLGAILAFEYARALRRAGRRQPYHLLVAAARAPHVPVESPIHHLPDASFLRELEDRYGGVPSAARADPQLLAYFLPVIRADLQLLASYRYRDEAPLACPLTALGGNTDVCVSAADLEQWRKHSTSSFESHVFPGGHFFITGSLQAAMSLVTRCVSRP